MNKQRITITDICNLVALQLGRSNVGAEHHILEHLGADSVDVMNIVATIEEKYRVEIEEEELVQISTVAQLHQLVIGKLSDLSA